MKLQATYDIQPHTLPDGTKVVVIRQPCKEYGYCVPIENLELALEDGAIRLSPRRYEHTGVLHGYVIGYFEKEDVQKLIDMIQKS